MKILVDKMPESPSRCPFSENKLVSGKVGYTCSLWSNNTRVVGRVKHKCDVNNCEHLISVKDMNIVDDVII